MANTIPQSSVPVSVAAAATTAAGQVTLGSSTNTGRSVYLAGFAFQASGATAAATITITASYIPVSGANINLGTWLYPITATATTLGVPLTIDLTPPMQSAVPITGATNIGLGLPVGTILLSFTAAGAGATFAGISAWGYLL